MLDKADLRYLEAGSVRCPGGELAGFRVCTEDAQPLGTVTGVLISPSARRLEYLVLESPGVFRPRQYLLPLEAGAVVEDGTKVLHIPARRDELALETFRARSVPRFSDEDLLQTVFGRDAA